MGPPTGATALVMTVTVSFLCGPTALRRFRPKTREELQNELYRLEKKHRVALDRLKARRYEFFVCPLAGVEFARLPLSPSAPLIHSRAGCIVALGLRFFPSEDKLKPLTNRTPM